MVYYIVRFFKYYTYIASHRRIEIEIIYTIALNQKFPFENVVAKIAVSIVNLII